MLEPLPLLSLIATSLCLRLVFETNMVWYYPMAMAVSLVLLQVVRGRISKALIGWLALVTVAYYPLVWGFDPLSYDVAPWIWQILILGSGLVLAAGPLVSSVRTDQQAWPVARENAGRAEMLSCR